MKVTTTEEVTRTYCDVCGINVNQGSTGWIGDKGTEGLVFCMSTRHKVPKSYPTNEYITLSCSQVASIFTNGTINTFNVKAFKQEVSDGNV